MTPKQQLAARWRVAGIAAGLTIALWAGWAAPQAASGKVPNTRLVENVPTELMLATAKPREDRLRETEARETARNETGPRESGQVETQPQPGRVILRMQPALPYLPLMVMKDLRVVVGVERAHRDNGS